ncbi:MAG: glycosyltransferase [Acidobacteriaceae bacterium]|nr:glycosyltransferase [Acidobacteriaceae bacterium]
MKIFVFGSSVTSTYWNGAATYYRGIYKNLHRLGHSIIFAEPDIYRRQQNRDIGDVDYADVRVYQTPTDLPQLLADAAKCDVVIKHSGVGADDEYLERQVLACSSDRTKVIFWDVDAPATLARVEGNPNDPFRELIPNYDLVLTYGGGPPVVEHYVRLAAKGCIPIYNALDPDTHHPVEPDPELLCDLAFIGHRLPDRETRVEEFFLRAATLAPRMSLLLGGEGWGSKNLPANVRWIGHVGSEKHNVVNCSARMVLNVNRESMARIGFSPPTRIFEAAGSAACVITDGWEGIESFFTPGKEILPATNAENVVNHLFRVGRREAQAIGTAMLHRALREHTYQLRAEKVNEILEKLFDHNFSTHPDIVASSAETTLCS